VFVIVANKLADAATGRARSESSTMSVPFFSDVDQIRYEGPDSDNALAFRWYDADRVVAGRTMRDHLRFAVSYWHSFNAEGIDIFGAGTLDRPWLAPGLDPMVAAHQKMDVAFEFLSKLGVPFYCFHDRDIAPEGSTFAESCQNLDVMVEQAAAHQERTGVGLLWGTANLFSNVRYQAGAATNPDPDLFRYAAAQVCHCMNATKRLGGANYVLWGGREGYETLLNTDMKRELDQLGRFFNLVVDHKHAIGFDGDILIEPKPFEPTKHQYDYDVATVFAFLQRYDLADEVKVNIEVNHATLAGHDFAHEVATAFACGIFGSIDANAGDDRLGWDVDRFPVSVEQMTLGMLEILRGGGFVNGGLNFDAKLRRQSSDRSDLFHAHIGGMDTMARALLAAAAILDDGELDRRRNERYAGWDGATDITGGASLQDLHDAQLARVGEPTRTSGHQEALENLVAKHIERTH
jgi:xylose isomerase